MIKGDIMKKKESSIKVNGVELKESERTPCEVWTRVMGYFRPMSQYNRGKQSEFRDRKWFVESKCGCCCRDK